MYSKYTKSCTETFNLDTLGKKKKNRYVYHKARRKYFYHALVVYFEPFLSLLSFFTFFFLNKIWISHHVLRMWYFWHIYHTLSNTSYILPIKTEPDVSTVYYKTFFSHWTRDTKITSDSQSFQSLRIYFSKFQKDWRLDRRKKLLTCWFSLDFTCFVHR